MSLLHRKLVTHYDNLKVAYNAPDVVIRAAYRALVQQFHPDKFPDRAVAEHRIKIINKAYEVLSDPDRRKEHDQWIADQSAHSANNEAQEAVGEASKNRASAATTLKKTTGQLAWRGKLEGWGRRAERIALGIALVLLIWLLGVDKNLLTVAPDHASSPAPAKTALAATVARGSVAAPRLENLDDAAQCFGTYEPIAQMGRDFSNVELMVFGQVRLRWFDSLLKRHQGEEGWSAAFERAIGRYTEDSFAVHNALRQALVANDARAFAIIIEGAVACDQKLGIATQFIPRL